MTFSTKLSARLSAVANTPISATSFAGDDARYTPAYEALEQEIGKAASLHTTGSLDWEAVSEDAETLLAEQSKDLRVAVWLTWSQYQRESFAGLHAGLVMIGILCRDHWQDVHPRKDRTRAAALSWLVPRMEQVLAEHVPMAEQLPLFEQIAKELRNLEACLATHLGHQAPLILPLCRRLDEMVKRAGASHPSQVLSAPQLRKSSKPPRMSLLPPHRSSMKRMPIRVCATFRTKLARFAAGG